VEAQHEAPARPAIRRLLVATPVQPRHLDRLRAAFPDVEIQRVDAPAPDALAAADAAVAWSIDAAALDGDDLRLRWLHTGGAGVEHLPLARLRERGIVVTNSSGVHIPSIPEHLLALMLAFARRLPTLIRAQAARSWRDEPTHSEVFDLQGQTVLLVGMGEIGLGLGERAAALGMRVTGLRRHPDRPAPPFVARVFGFGDLTAALADADHVAISLPITAETRGMFGAAAFAAMKPSAYLYNVGRGAVVDTAALVAALRSRRIAGAGLDVTDPEPLPADSPLWEMDDVVITSHTAGASPTYWDRGTDLVIDNLRRWRAGEPLRNEVDPGAGY
jgi:phosphoglycerate dehydrogenase-like enzyme